MVILIILFTLAIFFLWFYVKEHLKRSEKKLSDVYFSKDLDSTRIFVVICQRPGGEK